jgi:carboxypeptidase Q
MSPFLPRAFATLATAALFAACATPLASQPTTAVATPDVQQGSEAGARLRAMAMADTRAMRITEDLSTEVAYRLAGSDGEARARDWAVVRLQTEGFGSVRVEPFSITYWGRVSESIRVVGPHGQPLIARAIGGSPSTPQGGIEAEVVRFADLAALRAATREQLAGKIAYVADVMVAARDGSGYGPAVAKRRECAPLAAERGAVACVIRPAGTSQNHPHVGQGARGQQAPIPAAVISNAAASQLDRLIARGPVRLNIDLQTETRPNAPSGNVIAEVRGSERPDEIVVLACHLDTWDVAPGASDDAVGCGIVTSAVLNAISVAGQPRRTIRVIWFGAEEVGVIGGRLYAEVNTPEINGHVFAGESDSGNGAVWRFDTRFGLGAGAAADAIFADLAPLGIERGGNDGSAGPDVVPLQQRGVPIVDPVQDMMTYFDIHHTPDDVLEKIDPSDVRQNVAVWSIIAWHAAWSTTDFRAGGMPATEPMPGVQGPK